MGTLSHHTEYAVNCALLVYLYNNLVVDDNLNVILREGVGGLLSNDCELVT